MTLRLLLAVAAVSIGWITPAAVRGQSVETPRNFQAHADGDEVVVRWSSSPSAEAYVGEIDEDPQFDSPRRWAVEDDGRRVFEHRLRNLSQGAYYLRVRAVESFLLIKRGSPWSHVERVVVGRDSDVGSWPRDDRDQDRWPDDGWPDDRWPRDGRPVGASDDYPRSLEARASGDDVRLIWSPVRGANRYLLQVDTDRRFQDAYTFGVSPRDDRRLQEFVLRNVPSGRYYVRVRAEDGLDGRGRSRWSAVEVVSVGSGGDRDFRGEADLRNGRVLQRGDRRHPVFAEHPGRGRGLAKHEGKKHLRGEDGDRGGDWDEDEGEDGDD